MPTPVEYTSKSDRWFTPPDLMADVARFLGDYFDPCPPISAGVPVENGLTIPWRGRIYLNPPYGRVIGKWVDKALSEPVDELLLLVPARTSAAWFQPLFDHALCFICGRLNFGGPLSINTNAPFSSVLAYRGPRGAAFAQAFAHRGATMVRSPESRAARLVSLWDALEGGAA